MKAKLIAGEPVTFNVMVWLEFIYQCSSYGMHLWPVEVNWLCVRRVAFVSEKRKFWVFFLFFEILLGGFPFALVG